MGRREPFKRKHSTEVIVWAVRRHYIFGERLLSGGRR